MSTLVLALTATGAALLGLAIAAILLTGRQSTERRPGYITTAIARRRGYSWPSVPARAHTPAPLDRAAADQCTVPVRLLSLEEIEEMYGGPVPFDYVATRLEADREDEPVTHWSKFLEPSEQELARQRAQQLGGDAA